MLLVCAMIITMLPQGVSATDGTNSLTAGNTYYFDLSNEDIDMPIDYLLQSIILRIQSAGTPLMVQVLFSVKHILQAAWNIC